MTAPIISYLRLILERHQYAATARASEMEESESPAQLDLGILNQPIRHCSSARELVNLGLTAFDVEENQSIPQETRSILSTLAMDYMHIVEEVIELATPRAAQDTTTEQETARKVANS
jgi:hypothetical protein